MSQSPTMSRRPLIAGNWKMNGVLTSGQEILHLKEKLAAATSVPCEIVICPPYTLLHAFRALLEGSIIALGAQDCHDQPKGAHTGDISADMIKDVGAEWVIVGHSERRADHGESDSAIKTKAEAARAAGLKTILCVGESEAQKDAGDTLAVIGAQLDGAVPDSATSTALVIAYEPVWAIGTGRTPSRQDIAAVHAFIRDRLTTRFGPEGQAMRVLYGGSLKPGNAAEILAIDNVDGGLIGGASLKADDFFAIISACA